MPDPSLTIDAAPTSGGLLGDLERAREIAAALEGELARLDGLARAVVTGLHALHQEGVVNVTTWPHAQALIAWGEEDPCRP